MRPRETSKGRNALPAAEITVERICYITNESEYSSAEDLKFLKQLGVTVDLPRTSMELLNLLTNSEFSVLHFACNGNFELWRGRPVIHLPNGSSVLPADLENRAISARIKQVRPLIILNACQVTHSEATLVKIESWGKKFIDWECGAFAAFGWQFDKHLAAEFSINLYREFLEGTKLETAIKSAHSETLGRNRKSVDWLAYYKYGNPFCRISLSSPTRMGSFNRSSVLQFGLNKA